MNGVKQILSSQRAKNVSLMIEHVVKHNIEGDIIDIGVYEGHSAILAITKLTELNHINRNIYLYDTFEGMPVPSDEDGNVIQDLYKLETKKTKWAYCSLASVSKQVNVNTSYDQNKIFYIKGMVEDTLPINNHDKIAYLRLDTDYYSSTKAELEYLYPKLQSGGVLIVDDYKSKFVGCTKAVDDYFEQNNINLSSIIRFNNDCGFYFIKP
jgi:hypothetical protein